MSEGAEDSEDAVPVGVMAPQTPYLVNVSPNLRTGACLMYYLHPGETHFRADHSNNKQTNFTQQRTGVVYVDCGTFVGDCCVIQYGLATDNNTEATFISEKNGSVMISSIHSVDGQVPILINHRKISDGVTISLASGDTITIGLSTFLFQDPSRPQSFESVSSGQGCSSMVPR